MANYVLWNEIDFSLLQVKPPKKNETEIASARGKKGKAQKAIWYGCAITYIYPEGEDEFRVMWDNFEITGITISEFEDKKTGKVTKKEQVGGYGMLRPEHRDVRDKIRKEIITKAMQYSEYKDVDEDAWGDVKPENKKIKVYWKSKDDKTKTRVYLPVSKYSSFYTISKTSKDGWKTLPKKSLAETEELKLQITADVIERYKYLYVGQNVSIMYELYQSLVKKISRKDSTPIFKKPNDDIDTDAIDNALSEIKEARKQRGSDDEEDEDEDYRKKKPSKKPSAKKKMTDILDGDDDEDDDDEDDDEDDDKKKKKNDKKKPSKKEESEDEGSEAEEEEEEEEKPKKGKGKKAKKISDSEEDEDDE